MDEASKKNFKALSEGMKMLRNLYEEQQKEITKLKQEQAELRRENQEYKQQAIILAMTANGSGPTVQS